MNTNLAEAAFRLNRAGITWSPHAWSEQAKERFVDPRNPIRLVHHQGLRLEFTGTPTQAEADGTHTVSMLFTRDALINMDGWLAGLIADPTASLTLPTHQDPSTMNLLGPRGGIRLSSSEARWERMVFGAYRVPVSPALLADLRLCLESEALLLALATGTDTST